LQSSTGAGSLHKVLGIVAVQMYWVTAELYDVHNFIGVNAVPTKAVFSLGCRAALVQAACTGSQALFLCNSVRLQQSCMGCITS